MHYDNKMKRMRESKKKSFISLLVFLYMIPSILFLLFCLVLLLSLVLGGGYLVFFYGKKDDVTLWNVFGGGIWLMGLVETLFWYFLSHVGLFLIESL